MPHGAGLEPGCFTWRLRGCSAVLLRLLRFCADDKPFSFEAALQSHVGTHEVRLMEAAGFAGKLMLNCDASPDRPLLRICEEESSTYGGVPTPCSAPQP